MAASAEELLSVDPTAEDRLAAAPEPKRVQARIKAEDLARRGISHFTTPTVTPQETVSDFTEPVQKPAVPPAIPGFQRTGYLVPQAVAPSSPQTIPSQPALPATNGVPTTSGLRGEVPVAPPTVAQRGTIGEIGAGLVRGTGGVISSLGGLVRMLGAPETDVSGISSIPGLGKVWSGAHEAVGSAITKTGEAVAGAAPASPGIGAFEPSSPKWWAARLPEVVPQLAAQLGIAALTRGASLPAQIATFAGTGGGLMAGDVYNEAVADRVKRGQPADEARDGAIGEAAIVGTIGAALDAIPGGEFLSKNPVIRSLVGRTVRNKIAQRGISGFLAEGLTEAGQEVAQDLAALGFRDDAARFDNAWQRWAAAGLLGGVAGGGVNIALGHGEIGAPEEAPPVIPGMEAETIAPAPEPARDETTPAPVAGVSTSTEEGSPTGSEDQNIPAGEVASEQTGAPIIPTAETPPQPREVSQPPDQPANTAKEESVQASGEPVIPGVEPQPETPNATHEIQQQASVPEQPESGTPRGETEEAGARDSLQRPAAGEEDAVTLPGLYEVRVDLGDGVSAKISRQGEIRYEKNGSIVGRLETSETPEGNLVVETHHLNDELRGHGYGGVAILELSKLTGQRIFSDDHPSQAAQAMWERIGAKRESVTFGEGEDSEVSHRYVLSPKEAPTIPQPREKPPLETIVPALRIHGKLVRGKQGDTHQDILDRYMAEHPDDSDALVESLDDETHQFLAEGDEPITRGQLEKWYGERDSQGLARKQAPKIPTPVTPSIPTPAPPSQPPPLPPGNIVPTSGPAPPTPPNTPPGKIDSVFQRIIRLGRWFWEGTTDTLERAGYKPLATAIRQQFEVESKEFGETWKPIREVLERYSKKEIDIAKDEFAAYFKERENGRPVPTGQSQAGRDLIDAWKTVAAQTGARLTAEGVEVQNPDGTWRPIGNLGQRFFPRKINQETLKVLQEPEKYPAEWTKLVNDLIANGNIKTAAEADAFLREHVYHENAESDDFANIERARTGKLPESWLEYKFDEIAPWYTGHYARRLGQIVAYGQEHKGGDLFVQTLKTIPKRRGWSTTQEFVKAAKDAAYMRRDNTGLANALRNLQTFATGAFLTNPMSAIRNVVSGVSQTAVLHGPINTLKASWKVLTNFKDSIDMAHDLGVLRDDLMQMMVETRVIGDERPFARAMRKAANLGLKVSGFNLAERFARAVSLTAAKTFAADFKANPTGAKADQQRAFLIRHHVDPAKIEAGDVEETNRFIRNSVRESQGGYKFDQTPLVMADPRIGFLTQFGKWGTQMTRMWTKHAINPLIFGTDIGGGNIKRTALPLLYSMAFAIGGGELLYLIRGLFTDRDPPDASLEEIKNALTQNQKEGIRQLFNRAASDIITAGTLGMLSDYAGNLREYATRNRFKNPFDPPGVQAFKNVFNILATLKQQRKLTGDDIVTALETQFPGGKFVEQFGKKVAGEPVQKARNFQTGARQAGMRMAKELGLPVEAPFTASTPVKSPKTPLYNAINEALLAGDVPKAIKARDAFLATIPDEGRKKAVTGLATSIRSKQPISVGGIEGVKQRAQFLDWAAKRLPEDQLSDITELDARYWRTAHAAGLIKGKSGPPDFTET